MHNSDDTELSEREESNALNETLRITTRIIEAAAPPESYWPGYHTRLREKLDVVREPKVVTTSPSWISKLFRNSISIPVPVAVALVLVFMLSLLLVRRTPETTPPEVQVVHVPVEVPVVKEKIVTRVVYRETMRKPRQRSTAAQSDSAFARTLSGFKPTEEIKLTVIKGGANEK